MRGAIVDKHCEADSMFKAYSREVAVSSVLFELKNYLRCHFAYSSWVEVCQLAKSLGRIKTSLADVDGGEILLAEYQAMSDEFRRV